MISKDIIPKMIKSQDSKLAGVVLQVLEIKVMQEDTILVILSDELNLIEGNMDSTYYNLIQAEFKTNQLIELVDYAIINTEGRPSVNLINLKLLGVIPKQGNPQSIKKVMQQLNETYTPISALSTFLYDWTIRAKVTKKSELAEYNNRKLMKNDKFMTLRLSDCHGSQISASFFGEAAEKFFKIIQEGSIYLFSNGNVSLADQRFRTSDCSYQLQFNSSADIRLDEDQSFSVKAIDRGVTPLSKLKDCKARTLVDILGIVIEVGRPTEKTSKQKGEALTQRLLKIVDDSGMSIELSLWNELANDPNVSNLIPNESIIHAKSVNVTIFNETLYLSSVKSLTELIFNPTSPQSSKLMSWFKGGNKDSLQIVDLSLRKEGTKDNLDFITINQLKNCTAGKDRYFVIARIQFSKLDERKITYESCSKCKKKVEVNSEGMFNCISCGSFSKECSYKFLIRGLILGDFTGSIFTTAFNETGEYMFKIKAPEFAKKSEAEQEELIKSVGSNQYYFSVRKNLVDNRNDGTTRVEYTIGNIHPIYYADCTKRILNLIGGKEGVN